MNKKSTVYLICGFIGSGKTTFAKKLEKEIDAIRFTKDEWLIRLFGNDPKSIEDFEKHDDKICNLSSEVAFQCIKAGADVIIDDGFWGRNQRKEMIERIKDASATPILYYLDVPMKEMKRRTLERSKNRKKDSFVIDEKMFDKYANSFEPPGKDEDYILAD